MLTSVKHRQVSLPKDKLDALDVGDNQCVSDLVALTVGKVGENVSARRVTHVGVAANSHLETYVHATGSDVEVDGCKMGKYAILLDLNQDSDGSEEVGAMATVAKQLCQHILGLKPSTIGDFENEQPLRDTEDDKSLTDTDDKPPTDTDDKPLADADEKPLADTDDKPLADKDNKSPEDSDSTDDESDDEIEEEKSSKIKEDETRLVFQEFLFNPEMVVGEYLQENKATVNKFVRVECGAELPSES